MITIRDLLARHHQLDVNQLFKLIPEYYLYDEEDYVNQLLDILKPKPEHAATFETENSADLEPQVTDQEQQTSLENHQRLAAELIDQVNKLPPPVINQFLDEYQLNQKEGVQLLALAEGLLRIKDNDTANRFLQDKILNTDWESHKHQSSHTLVNIATEGLSLLKSWLKSGTTSQSAFASSGFQNWISNGSNRIAQQALKLMISRLASVFVKASSIESAVNKPKNNVTHCCSFDMLGEAALTEEDADRYLASYLNAIQTTANSHKVKNSVDIDSDATSKNSDEMSTSPNESTKAPSDKADSISIKLSALTPKFNLSHQQPLEAGFLKRIETLVRTAHQEDIALTFDAEEAERLELTLLIFQHCFTLPGLKGWGKLGLAVQAYSYRAAPTLLWLGALAKSHQTIIPVRLVKGAYWDSEINHAQQLGLIEYPVLTQKPATDLNYQLCTRLLLKFHAELCIEPQFASHNLHTLLMIQQEKDRLISDPETDTSQLPSRLEYQRLHGMGTQIYQAIAQNKQLKDTFYCRSYCPVGPYHELLPYLIRRILENGANQSFLRNVGHQDTDALMANPAAALKPFEQHRKIIPLPCDCYLPVFTTAPGFNINQLSDSNNLQNEMTQYFKKVYRIEHGLPSDTQKSLIDSIETSTVELFTPHNQLSRIGISQTVTAIDTQTLLQHLNQQTSWSSLPVRKRINIIKQFAQNLSQHRYELIALLVREAGKSWQDAISELREAIDFCNYYAAQTKQLKPLNLPSTSSEANQLSYHAKGTFICISPWNFPIAILVGQVVAALLTGNRVIIKPAPQTHICGRLIYDLLLNANVPNNAVFFLPCSNNVAEQLIQTKGFDGIAFTGSLATAKHIHKNLIEHHDYSIPLISETSGLNCMITDDSVLTEQMVRDVIHSAFGSAGQRCSALRVLYLHQVNSEESIKALIGAMATLNMGNPENPANDIGAIIDKSAARKLEDYLEDCRAAGKLIYQIPDTQIHAEGNFIMPSLIKLTRLAELDGEHFGPILHIVEYTSEQLPQILQDINQSEYGLTLGIHSRDTHWVDAICQKLTVGNIYINRHITGAQVGAQPFGGHKKSGNGFKTGGPNYLLQFINEQCISENTAAIGGNITLITQN
jgi:RHH-type proline utilization regulon transcriptional repressor/proline dehydrogenase/delta 1-pyrroline-5-carboxylate dehydrogenase